MRLSKTFRQQWWQQLPSLPDARQLVLGYVVGIAAFLCGTAIYLTHIPCSDRQFLVHLRMLLASH